jgi:hypothetical protein
MNDGKPMRLRRPFDTIAIYRGAIHLSSSTNSTQELRVPGGSKAWLTGIVADDAASLSHDPIGEFDGG